jgi:cell division protein ZapA
MNDRPANGSGNAEPASAEIDVATRRLMAALDALESAVERRREADRDENELAARIQALGVDRSRLADELDGSLVKSRRLERTNREIAERLDAAIGTINGRQYRMACEEGQEARLLQLAESFEARIGNLRGKFGEIGDARLTVMAALTVSDELLDASHRVRSLEEELDALRNVRVVAADRAKATQTAVANALNAAADRIEKTTQVLNRTIGGGVAIG